MIPIKDAIEKAVGFARGVLEPARTGTILLEEVETGTLSEKGLWLITLSLPDPDYPQSFGGHRQYKTFTIDGETGEVLAMKIRQLNGVT